MRIAFSNALHVTDGGYRRLYIWQERKRRTTMIVACGLALAGIILLGVQL